MSPLDQALANLQENPKETANLHAYYDLFLNSVLFVPGYSTKGECLAKEAGAEVLPLVMQADGKEYMVMFDSEQRAQEWAQEEVYCLALPGVVIAEMSKDEIHWGLNPGTEHQKEFIAQEIAWLKEVVKSAKDAEKEAAQDA